MAWKGWSELEKQRQIKPSPSCYRFFSLGERLLFLSDHLPSGQKYYCISHSSFKLILELESVFTTCLKQAPGCISWSFSYIHPLCSDLTIRTPLSPWFHSSYPALINPFPPKKIWGMEKGSRARGRDQMMHTKPTRCPTVRSQKGHRRR